MPQLYCRLCLQPSVLVTPLTPKLIEMVKLIASIKITSPSYICTKCTLNIKLAYRIQQNIVEADKQFQKIPQIPMDIQIMEEMQKEEEQEENSDLIRLTENECIICLVDLYNIKEATNHVKKHFSGSQICDICFTVHRNINDFKCHNKYAKHESVCFVCMECKVSFQYKSLYNVHLRAHRRKKLMLEYYAERRGFRHDKAHPKSSLALVKKKSSVTQLCDICGLTFSSSGCYKKHIIFQHTTVRPFQCNVCQKSFKMNTHLRNHKLVHSKANPYVCQYCGKGFKRFNTLSLHHRQHTNEKPYKCQFCGMAFKQNVLLRRHKSSKHHIFETPICSCDKCGKEFSSNIALNSHNAKVHS